jgi:hypothetical protein
MPDDLQSKLPCIFHTDTRRQRPRECARLARGRALPWVDQNCWLVPQRTVSHQIRLIFTLNGCNASRRRTRLGLLTTRRSPMRRARLLSALVLPAVLALPAGATGSAPASARTAAPQASALSCSRSHLPLPDPACTPGVTNPNVRQGTIGSTICVSGWTATVRPPTSYTNPLKTQQIRQYGTPTPGWPATRKTTRSRLVWAVHRGTPRTCGRSRATPRRADGGQQGHRGEQAQFDGVRRNRRTGRRRAGHRHRLAHRRRGRIREQQPRCGRCRPRPDHVVAVVMENHSYGDVIDSSAAPYINSLASASATFTASTAITHPSEPNYLALYSGSTRTSRGMG